MKRRRTSQTGDRDGDLFAEVTPSLFRWNPFSHAETQASEPPEQETARDSSARTRPHKADDAGAVPVVPARHTVHVFVTVCVKLTGIVADSPRAAAQAAQECFCWEDHGRTVEFVDELHEFLVDVESDPDYSRSAAFTADLEPVP